MYFCGWVLWPWGFCWVCVGSDGSDSPGRSGGSFDLAAMVGHVVMVGFVTLVGLMALLGLVSLVALLGLVGLVALADLVLWP